MTRALVALLLLGLVACGGEPDPLVADLREGGFVLFVRHAATVETPDRTDDPENCPEQRNLSAAGRDDAAAMGEAVAALEIPIAEVLTSRWCRALDTAELAFAEVAVDERLLPSADPEEARGLLDDPPAGGNRVLVGHLSTITGLADLHLEEGETAVFAAGGELVTVVAADDWAEMRG